MGTEIALLEQAALPSLERGRLPSLPAWAGPLRSALALNMQMVGDHFAEVPTLPAGMVPNAEQRQEIEQHQRNLSSLLNQTPESDERYAIKTAEIASKLLLSLGGDKKDELAAEAKGEAYVAALDDVPWWAVSAASRAWYRGEAKDDAGKPYDYQWPPDPATLRKIAMGFFWQSKSQVRYLQTLLEAMPYVDHSEELRKGHRAYGYLIQNMKGDLKTVSFDEAAAKGVELAGEIQ